MTGFTPETEACLACHPSQKDAEPMTDKTVDEAVERVKAYVESWDGFDDGTIISDNCDPNDLILSDLRALLDEVARLRSRAAPDPCEAQVPFDTPDGVTWFPAPLGSADPFDRATRAEAHAERLAEGLEALASGLETIMPFAKDGMDFSLAHTLVDQARSALSAYRSAKDAACSRPSDALDAPVADQSTTCSQPVER